jgi:CrcB protein
MKDLFLVAIGGATGSGLRWWMGSLPLFQGSFPYKTLFVNVLATAVLGFLFVFMAKTQVVSKEIRLLLGVGFCGGLSTFSTFSLETFELIRSGNWTEALLYPMTSVLLCLAVLFLLSKL